MITLKLSERFVGKRQINNLGAIFFENKDLNESGNGIVFFFKEKITLKHLKIIRPTEQRVRL